MSAPLSIGRLPVVCLGAMHRPIHDSLAGEIVRSCDGAGCKAAAGASSGRHPTKRSRSSFSVFPAHLIDLGASTARSAALPGYARLCRRGRRTSSEALAAPGLSLLLAHAAQQLRGRARRLATGCRPVWIPPFGASLPLSCGPP